MKHLPRTLLVAAMLAAVSFGAFADHGSSLQSPGSYLLAENAPRGGARISMGGAMEMVQRQTGGRVLNAQEAQQGGRPGYRIKVLTRSGEVRVFFVDANSGAISQD